MYVTPPFLKAKGLKYYTTPDLYHQHRGIPKQKRLPKVLFFLEQTDVVLFAMNNI